MRKTSLLLLFIALCTTLIVPVSAKTSWVTLSGAVKYSGYASVRDNKNCIEIKVISKKPLETFIVFTDAWPGSLADTSSDTPELLIYINKKNGNVKMNYAWGDYNPSIAKYILKARGTAGLPPIEGPVIEIILDDIVTEERVKPNEFLPDGSSTGPIVFSIELIT
jgi:hypothetical protein